MVKDMIATKYKAIINFFNAIARSIERPTLATNFVDIYNHQLSSIVQALKLNDSFSNSIIYLEADPYKMAKEILESNDAGIDFLSQIIPFDTKTLDEIAIGKVLVGVIYCINIMKPDLFKSALQQVDRSQNFDQEIEHIIFFLENKEQWPRDGWPMILNTSTPVDFYDRINPLPVRPSGSVARTPMRRSMRQPPSISSPYKRSSADSPITKPKDKEYKQRIRALEKQLLENKYYLETVGKNHDELFEENKTIKNENQKLKNFVESAKHKLGDYHSLADELKKTKLEKENLQKEIKILTDKNRAMTDEVNNCYKELEASVSEVETKDYKIELLEKTNASYCQQIADLNDELMEAKGERESLRMKLVNTEKALNRVAQDYDTIKMQNSEMTRMSLSVADQNNINLSDENQRLRDQITEMTKKFEDEKDELEQEFEKKKALLNAEIERLNTKLTEGVREHEKRKAEVEMLKKKDDEANAELLKYRSENAELMGQLQGLKDVAEEWRKKFEDEQKGLTKIQEDNNNLVKQKKVLKETINAQNDDISIFKRKAQGGLAINKFSQSLSSKQKSTTFLPEFEPPCFHVSKFVLRTPQEFYFTRSN